MLPWIVTISHRYESRVQFLQGESLFNNLALPFCGFITFLLSYKYEHNMDLGCRRRSREDEVNLISQNATQS